MSRISSQNLTTGAQDILDSDHISGESNRKSEATMSLLFQAYICMVIFHYDT